MTTPARRWSSLHHGIEVDDVPLLRGWLTLLWTLARPLARLRVPPTAGTAAGALLAVGAVLLAAHRPWVAAGAVVLAALCDGLDGAVAVVRDAATSAGALADAVADRVADIAFALVLWRVGVPWLLAVIAALLAVGVDAVRRAVRRPAMITVGERPSWTVCATLACICAGLTAAGWPVLTCAAVWIALGAIGLLQLLAKTS